MRQLHGSESSLLNWGIVFTLLKSPSFNSYKKFLATVYHTSKLFGEKRILLLVDNRVNASITILIRALGVQFRFVPPLRNNYCDRLWLSTATARNRPRRRTVKLRRDDIQKSRDMLFSKYTKLHAFSLRDFNVILHVDADVIILDRAIIAEIISHVSSGKLISAPPDYYKLCNKLRHMKFTCDTTYRIFGYLYFNTGIFVLTPSNSTYTRLMSALQDENTCAKTDQSALNQYIRQDELRCLPHTYDCVRQSSSCDPCTSEVHAVHFPGPRGKLPLNYSVALPHMASGWKLWSTSLHEINHLASQLDLP